MRNFSALRLSLSFSAIRSDNRMSILARVNTASLKALIALVPASMLFFGSTLLFLRERPFGLFYSWSAQGVWLWWFLPMSLKHFTCLGGCIGDMGTALATISIFGAPFLVFRCFRQDIYYIHSRCEIPDRPNRIAPANRSAFHDGKDIALWEKQDCRARAACMDLDWARIRPRRRVRR